MVKAKGLNCRVSDQFSRINKKHVNPVEDNRLE